MIAEAWPAFNPHPTREVTPLFAPRLRLRADNITSNLASSCGSKPPATLIRVGKSIWARSRKYAEASFPAEKTPFIREESITTNLRRDKAERNRLVIQPVSPNLLRTYAIVWRVVASAEARDTSKVFAFLLHAPCGANRGCCHYIFQQHSRMPVSLLSLSTSNEPNAMTVRRCRA